LQIDPEIGAIAEELAEAQRHTGSDGLFLIENVVERLTGNAEQPRDLALGFAKRRQHILAQHLAGMHRL
jgi:hypothetical protein